MQRADARKRDKAAVSAPVVSQEARDALWRGWVKDSWTDMEGALRSAVRAAKADALREAADSGEEGDYHVGNWLYLRADRIERGET